MILDVQGLNFSYNGVSILKDVSFSVNEGDFLAIIGPNGSGKSTLLKNLDGILNPQSGAIIVDNTDQNKMTRRDIAKLIGYVPQRESNLFPSTVFECVLMGRKPHIDWKDTKEDRMLVAKTLEQLELGEFALRNINELSGGEQQKVYLARSLVQKPKILLLDEPTANLDLKHQIEVLNLLLENKRAGLTVIIAIHDLNLALKYCDKMIILNKGEIFAKGGREILTKENIENVYGIKVSIFGQGEKSFIIPEGSLEDSNVLQ